MTVKVNAIEENGVFNDVVVKAKMSDYFGVKNPRDDIEIELSFGCGFSYESLISIISMEIGAEWFETYGVDDFGNRYGDLRYIEINKEN